MIGIGRVEPHWRVSLAPSIQKALQLKEKDTLHLYFEYSPLHDDLGARLVALQYPLTTSSYRGGTRGSTEEIQDIVRGVAALGRFETLFLRKGRTKSYSMNYIASLSFNDAGHNLANLLNERGSLVYNQPVIELGQDKAIGKECFRPLLNVSPFPASLDTNGRIRLPSSLDPFMIEKLGLEKARFAIQTVDPDTERLFIVFTESEKLIDVLFVLLDIESHDFADFLDALFSLGLSPETLIKRPVSSPVKCRVSAILDPTSAKLSSAISLEKSALDRLKSEINQTIRGFQGSRGEVLRDIVDDIQPLGVSA